MRAGVPGHVQALRRPARPAPREDVPSVRLDLDGAAAMLLLMLLDVLRTLAGVPIGIAGLKVLVDQCTTRPRQKKHALSKCTLVYFFKS